MSTNLRLSSSASGTQNTFDRTVNFVSTYGGVSGGSQATNTTALGTFNTAYAAFSGRTRLIIPPGDYDFTADTAYVGALGGDKLFIEAPGATLRHFGGFSNFNSGMYNDNTHHAYINTANSGDISVGLVTSGETSRFTAGRYVVVACIDTQGFGVPPNPAIFEFKKIASIGSGTLTFTEPLTYSYKSTYPLYNAGGASQIPLGGPAIVYAIRDIWDQEMELVGATITDVGGLIYGKTRVAKFTDCTFETYGPCPSVNILFRMLRCTCAGFGGIEVDKIVQRAEIIDSAPRAMDFQSASINDLYVNNVASSTRWRGGGRNNYFKGLTTADFEFGTMNYGVMGPTYMENSVATASTWMFFNKFPFADYTEEGAGVLSYSGGPAPSSRVGYWAVPGQYCVLTDDNATPGFAQSFQVTNVTQSGGKTYVTTTLPFPLPGTINGKSPPWAIYTHPCADATLVNCSGSSLFTSQSLLPAHSPLFGWTL